MPPNLILDSGPGLERLTFRPPPPLLRHAPAGAVSFCADCSADRSRESRCAGCPVTIDEDERALRLSGPGTWHYIPDELEAGDACPLCRQRKPRGRLRLPWRKEGS